MESLTRALLAGRRTAVVGVAKNCGKTTTLNFMLRLADRASLVCGAVSIGVDGERADLLLGTPKPPVRVLEGQWVVSAQAALGRATARLEYVEPLDGVSSPLGEVVLARVLEAGEVMLAGVVHRADVVRAIRRMEAQGVARVIVDGAYGRVTAAHGDVADHAVVSTGAVVSATVEGIVVRTAELVERLTLDAVGLPWRRRLVERAAREDRALLGGPDVEPRELPSPSALVGLSDARDLWTPAIGAIAVPGLVSDRVLEELMRLGGQGRTLLLPDATALQANPALVRRFRRTWNIEVLHSCRVAGISINPTAIQGHGVDGEQLERALTKRWPDVAVFDPCKVPLPQRSTRSD